MKKTHKVVMLPTEKAENCIAMYHNGKISWTNQLLTKSYMDSANVKVFHLYIISDDEANKGNGWVIFRNKEILNINDYTGTTIGFREQCKKIVATTDKSLQEYISDSINKRNPLPQIPVSFIQAYIKAYNEGSPITEVALEVENSTSSLDFYEEGRSNIIKTRPDNTIIIHQSKMYSRDEVARLLKVANLKRFTYEEAVRTITLDQWIENNL